MAPDALDIDNPVGFSNNACIVADDATIGPSIDEGTTMSSVVLANIVCEVGKIGLALLGWLRFCCTAGRRG